MHIYMYACYHESSRTQPQLEWKCDASDQRKDRRMQQQQHQHHQCMLFVCLSPVCLHLINTCVRTSHSTCIIETTAFPHPGLRAFCEFVRRKPVTWQQTAGKQNSCANVTRWVGFLHVCVIDQTVCYHNSCFLAARVPDLQAGGAR